MNIVLVTTRFGSDLDTVGVYVRSLARQLQRMGHTCQIAHISPKHVESVSSHSDGVLIHQVPAKGYRQAIRFAPIDRQIGAVDLIDVHDPALAGLAMHFLKNRVHYGHARLSLTTHGHFQPIRRLNAINEAYFRFIAPRVLGGFDRIICSSVADMQRYRSKVPDDRLCVLEGGIDTTAFRELAAHCGDPQQCIYFGPSVPSKNLGRLAEAFVQLAQRMPMTLHIVAEGKARLLSRLATAGRGVVVHPALDSAAFRGLLAKCRYFVTATRHETFAQPIIEAMAAGRIVVANDIPYVHSILEPGKTGFLVDFEAPINLVVAQLMGVLRLPDPIAATISNAARDATAAFAWNARNDAISRAITFDAD